MLGKNRHCTMTNRTQDPWERADLPDEAQRRTKLFVGTVLQLAHTDGLAIDLMVAPGNSGIMMAALATMTYQRLGLRPPHVLKVPIYLRDRRGGRINYDNTVLVPGIRRQLVGLNTMHTILHVDDETEEENPRTLKITLDLLRAATDERVPVEGATVHVVAELDEKPPSPADVLKTYGGWQIEFHPYARETEEWKGVFNFISYGIPYAIAKPVRDLYSDGTITAKELFCILLSEPIRDFDSAGQPILSRRWERKLEQEVPYFADAQQRFRRHVEGLIDEAVQNAGQGMPGQTGGGEAEDHTPHP